MEHGKRMVLVFGCPGSGKTTFSQELGKMLGNVLLVSGDQVEKALVQTDIDTMKERLDSYQVKEHPQCISIAEILQVDTASTPHKFDPEVWKASRQFIKDNLPMLVELASTIIIEDDFLLASTRKPFRSYCARAGIPYGEVYMDSTLEQCIGFNRLRNGKLDEQLIRQKHRKMEISGLRLRPEQRRAANILERIVCCLAVPELKVQQDHPPVEYADYLELVDIEIRRQVGQLMRHPELLIVLFDGNPPPVKQASQIISTFKRSYPLRQGSADFLPKLKQWLAKQVIT